MEVKRSLIDIEKNQVFTKRKNMHQSQFPSRYLEANSVSRKKRIQKNLSPNTNGSFSPIKSDTSGDSQEQKRFELLPIEISMNSQVVLPTNLKKEKKNMIYQSLKSISKELLEKCTPAEVKGPLPAVEFAQSRSKSMLKIKKSELSKISGSPDVNAIKVPTKPMKKYRSDMVFLNKHLKNPQNSMSILDFWSNSMKFNVGKLLQSTTPDKKIKKPIQKVEKTSKKAVINDSSPIGLKRSLSMIIDACNIELCNSVELKTKLNSKYLHLQDTLSSGYSHK